MVNFWNKNITLFTPFEVDGAYVFEKTYLEGCFIDSYKKNVSTGGGIAPVDGTQCQIKYNPQYVPAETYNMEDGCFTISNDTIVTMGDNRAFEPKYPNEILETLKGSFEVKTFQDKTFATYDGLVSTFDKRLKDVAHYLLTDI